MTPDRKPAFQHRLQQQPQRFVDRQQQQSSGSREFQPRQPSGQGNPLSQMDGQGASIHPFSREGRGSRGMS